MSSASRLPLRGQPEGDRCGHAMKRWRYRRGVGRSRDAYTAPSPFGCTADDKNPYSGNVFVHGFGCGVEWRLARRYSRIQDSIYLGQGPPDGDSTGRRNHARNAFIDGILWIPILGLRFRILAGGFSASFSLRMRYTVNVLMPAKGTRVKPVSEQSRPSRWPFSLVWTTGYVLAGWYLATVYGQFG
jgi:hypothetical protein